MRATPKVKNDMHVNRRSFLCASAVAAGGLVVSLYLDPPAAARERNQAPPAKVYPPDAFVNIRPDGKIVIQVNRLEFGQRSEEHTSELQSLITISYAVFCLKKKTKTGQKSSDRATKSLQL